MESRNVKTLYEDAYREIEAISKVLRKAIRHMPKYSRYIVGDRIVTLIIDIKLEVKITLMGYGHPADIPKLYNSLMSLNILVDDQIEDGSLLLKGEHTVHEAKIRLNSLILTLRDILPQDGCGA